MYRIGEIIGYVGVFLSLFMYVSKKRSVISIMKIVTESISIVGYLFCSLYLLAVLSTIAVLRQVIFHFRPTKKWADKRVWLWLFIALTFVSPTIDLVSKGLQNVNVGVIGLALLPVIGSIFCMFGYYSKSALTAKFLIAPGVVLYFVYDICVMHIPSIIGAGLGLISLVIGFINEYISYKYNKRMEVIHKVEDKND